MKIREIPIVDIQRAKYNPRKALKPGDPAYDRLDKSLKKFGTVEPLIWNERSGVLVGGHQRLTWLEGQGVKSVTVSVVDLSDRDEKMLNLALNKQGGEWEYASLSSLLQELGSGDADMEVAGFTDLELEKLMTWQPANPGLTDENEIPEPPIKPVAKRGELWALGNHRILCGDATLEADVRRAIGKTAPVLMVTDPPYGVNYDPAWRAAAGINKNKKKMGKVSNDATCDWRQAWALFPGAVAYIWHAGRYAREVAESIESVGFELRSQIIWIKDRFALSRGHYHWQHEPCWYAVRKGETGNWNGGRKQSTLWSREVRAAGDMLRAAQEEGDWSRVLEAADQLDLLLQSTTWKVASRDDGGHGHSTQKPVECMRRPMQNHTVPGQVVYDPFLGSGSGSGIIAAESSGRICVGLEIDPVYVDVCIKRWEAFTGKKAKRCK